MGNSKDFYAIKIEEKLPELEKKPLSHPANQHMRYSAFTIFLVVGFYWITSLAVVFLNKFILSSSEYKFPYPLTVTWFQLLVAFVLLVSCGELGKHARCHHNINNL